MFFSFSLPVDARVSNFTTEEMQAMNLPSNVITLTSNPNSVGFALSPVQIQTGTMRDCNGSTCSTVPFVRATINENALPLKEIKGDTQGQLVKIIAGEEGIDMMNIAKNPEFMKKLLEDSGFSKLTPDQLKKKFQDELNKQKSTQQDKPKTDKCILITPGMSKELGTMYGEENVKANNDEHRFCDKIQEDKKCGNSVSKEKAKDCTITGRSKSLPTSRAESLAPVFTDINPRTSEGNCVWAVDYAGYPAYSTKGSKGKGMESKENHDMRDAQKYKDPNPFSVTFKTDADLIKKTGALMEEIHTHTRNGGDAPDPNLKGKSNEEISLLALGNNKLEKDPYRPGEKEHLEYLKKNAYEAPGGEVMTPGTFTAGESTTSAGNAAGPGVAGDSPDAKKNNGDVLVTEGTCEFVENPQKPPKTPDSNAPFSNGTPNSPGNPGAVNPGGNPGDSNSLLNKILPALMQALQGLGQGGGGNQGGGQQGDQGGGQQPQGGGGGGQQGGGQQQPQQSNQNGNQTGNQNGQPYPFYTGDDTACPAIYQPVCGSDKKTYSNTCELERESRLRSYLSPLTVAKQGICESNATTGDLSSLVALIEQATQNGIPSSILESAIRTVTNLITSMLVGETNTTGTVVP